ncbi:MAG TPA: TonB family protein, partial [Acidobacteriota bacterium]|nr:TonB family protein [Acidobacteriota bacterium]
GGGLPYFGVFSGEQIYTVYLDMRTDESDTTPSWTLEFAVVGQPAGSVSATASPVGGKEGLILPFPMVKETPAFPADLAARHRGRMVIVYAVVTAEGKLEELSVKDSPDDRFNEIALRALRAWTFRPARLGDAAVSARMLMGIPIRSPE